MRESFLGFLSNDLVAGELGTDVTGLFSISIDTSSDTGVLQKTILKRYNDMMVFSILNYMDVSQQLNL